MSDLDIGMNDWMCKELDLGQHVSAGPRQSAVGRRARSGEGVLPLRRRRRRRYPVSHAAGRASARLVFPARLGAQPVRRRTPRTRPSTSRCWTGSRRSGGRRPRSCRSPRFGARASRRSGASSPSAAATRAIDEALDRLAKQGVYADYCRIRAFPFGKKVTQFLEQHERVFVVEQNRDAQLKTLLLAETQYPAARMTSILHYGGLPMDHRCIVETLEQAAAREWLHDVDCETEDRPRGPRAQRARAHGARLRRRHVDACAPAAVTIRSRRRLCRHVSSSAFRRTASRR